jgi:vacuolar-type H+-ATPase subunit I/STV1
MTLTTEQIEELTKRLAELEGKERDAWEKIAALDEQKRKLHAVWSPIYQEVHSIQTVLALAKKGKLTM